MKYHPDDDSNDLEGSFLSVFPEPAEGDKITFLGKTPITIKLVSNDEYTGVANLDFDAEAILLESILITRLPAETYRRLAICINKRFTLSNDTYEPPARGARARKNQSDKQ